MEVHHKDKNRYNNTVNNLIYLTRAEHTALHIQERKERVKE
jgi:hypothetical protein